jgi:hypothetical protein
MLGVADATDVVESDTITASANAATTARVASLVIMAHLLLRDDVSIAHRRAAGGRRDDLPPVRLRTEDGVGVAAW